MENPDYPNRGDTPRSRYVGLGMGLEDEWMGEESELTLSACGSEWHSST